VESAGLPAVVVLGLFLSLKLCGGMWRPSGDKFTSEGRNELAKVVELAVPKSN
jgi:hypothetical protein